MMKKLVWVLFVALLAACSNRPADVVIREQVTAALTERFGSAIFEVENLKKVNGIPRDDNTYDVEVEYDLRFLVSLEEAAPTLQRQGGSIFTAGVQAAALGVAYGNFRAGDTLHRQERVRFIRTEKGWLIEAEER